jgi:hypothetical protein
VETVSVDKLTQRPNYTTWFTQHGWLGDHFNFSAFWSEPNLLDADFFQVQGWFSHRMQGVQIGEFVFALWVKVCLVSFLKKYRWGPHFGATFKVKVMH